PHALECAARRLLAGPPDVHRRDAVLLARELEPRHQVLALVAVPVVLQPEDRSGREQTARALERRVLGLDPVAVEPRPRQQLAQPLLVPIPARAAILEQIAPLAGGHGRKVELRLTPVVVAEPHLLLVKPRTELGAPHVPRPEVALERLER